MNYETGIHLYPMPYDWRQLAGSSEIDNTFRRTLEYSMKMNGKKMLIVAHSLGGVHSNVILSRYS
jgi:hypothetical protein